MKEKNNAAWESHEKRLNDKIFLILLICMVLVPVTIFAGSRSIDGGSGSWYGGIDENTDTIYSKVWDHKVDGRRYQVTVWAMDDTGYRDEVTGTTTGVDARGEVIVTKKATHNRLLRKNECGFKDLSIITSYGFRIEDYNSLNTITELQFEIE